MKKQIFTSVAVCAATFSIGQNRFAKNDLVSSSEKKRSNAALSS